MDNVFLNSAPSFLAGSSLIFTLRLITIKYETSLNYLLVITILLQVAGELSQFFFPKYSTLDYIDILFAVIGTLFSYLLIKSLEKIVLSNNKKIGNYINFKNKHFNGKTF